MDWACRAEVGEGKVEAPASVCEDESVLEGEALCLVVASGERCGLKGTGARE